MFRINRLRQLSVVGLAVLVSVSAAWAAAGLVTRLNGKLASAGSLKGKIAFVEETRNGTRQKLSIEMQGAQVGQALPVIINGAHLVTLKGDATGRARIELREGGDDVGQVVLPDMKAGDVVTVGSASGIMHAQ